VDGLVVTWQDGLEDQGRTGHAAERAGAPAAPRIESRGLVYLMIQGAARPFRHGHPDAHRDGPGHRRNACGPVA
jgi:hypothetical protein